MGMSLLDAAELLRARGEWVAAETAFEAALTSDESAEALDGLSQVLWWLARPDEAIVRREQAYTAFRRRGDLARAGWIALWLSREYSAVHGNNAAASGWLARAEGVLDELPDGPEHGWLALTRAVRAFDPTRGREFAAEALELARAHRDADLEVRALARLGLAEVSAGDVEEGMRHLNEAMAAATAGEPALPETIGETSCDLLLAADLVSDHSWVGQWFGIVNDIASRAGSGSLLGFCGSCCGELSAATGDPQGAEQELLSALSTLAGTGVQARCVHPAITLAELRISQGRFEDAARLLEGHESLPEASLPRISLALATGAPVLAATLAERQMRAFGADGLLSVPYLALLVEACLANGDVGGAAAAVERLGRIAEATALPRVEAETHRAAGQLAMAREDRSASARLERARELFSKLHLPLEAARTQLLIADHLTVHDPEVAMVEANSALATFERLSAVRYADTAAALLRRLGGRARTGPKGYGTLTRREREILDLVAEGLTNAEIAGRVFISVKTAGNHVSNILTKLGLRSRSEAAVYAVRGAGRR